MAAIGRGAAVVQMLGGRTMKGKTAQLAWGTVHPALLPTNEDRAKAVVDWAGAGLTHERAGRITVDLEKEGASDGRDSTGVSSTSLAGAGTSRCWRASTATVRFDVVDGRRSAGSSRIEKGDIAVSRKNAAPTAPSAPTRASSSAWPAAR